MCSTQVPDASCALASVVLLPLVFAAAWVLEVHAEVQMTI